MEEGSSHIERFLTEAGSIADHLDREAIQALVDELLALRQRAGRLFVVGSGGSAGNASHAVCDFRKLAGFEAYAPTDNISELTARINDEGWDTSYAEWLKESRLADRDLLLVLSVGGGDRERNISSNLVLCIEEAKRVGARICGIVGRDGGETARLADACVVVPVVNDGAVTPHTESFQATIWHLLVSHPDLRTSEMKWESTR